MGKAKLKLYKSQTETVRRMDSTELNKFMATQAVRLMEPYVPASSDMTLTRTVVIDADAKKARITYTQKYAHFQYMGEVYISPTTGSPWAKKDETKIPAGRPLVYDKMTHPLATNHWDKAMMTAKGDALLTAIKKEISK